MSMQYQRLIKNTLMCACEAGYCGITSYLISHRAYVNIYVDNVIAMSYACNSKSWSCANELLENGALVDDIIDNNETTILHYAWKTGCCDIVQILLRKGAKIDCYATCDTLCGQFFDIYIHPLHYACFSGSYQIVKTVIQHLRKLGIKK